MIGRKRLIAASIAGVIGAGTYVAVKYRPRPSHDLAYHEAHPEDLAPEPKGVVEAAVYKATQAAVLGVSASAISALMHATMDIDIIDKWKLDRFIETDRRGRALVTVMNHHSCLDDPAVVSALCGSGVRWRPSRMRWGVCTEEMCFFNSAASAYFGLGKAFPILRGGTLDQRATAFLLSKLDLGEWVHVFPEGRTWQEGGTPPRDLQGRWCSPTGRCTPPFSKVGPFKWGIGKVIANSKRPPIVVPMFHLGMQEFLPQSEDNEVISWIPRTGGNVTVVIGDPVPVDDLITSYHEEAEKRAQEREKRRSSSSSSISTTFFSRTRASSPAKSDEDGGDDQEGNGRSGEEKKSKAESLVERVKVFEEEAVGKVRGAVGDVEDRARSARDKAKATFEKAEHEAEEIAEGVKERISKFRDLWKERVEAMKHYYDAPPVRGEEDEAGRADIPAKTLKDGTVVPAFRDAPLRIRPPDHDLLTEEEAKEEQTIRLQLYRDITIRVENAMVAIEHKARERRKEKGYAHVDDRQE